MTPPATASSDLLDTLLVELFQTERSAIAHPEREGLRHAGTPPGDALLAISEHAKGVFPSLEQLAAFDDHKLAKLGAVVGELLSTVRDAVVDRVVSVEKSYRGTLLGLHHGIDLVTLVRHLAKDLGKDELAAWCKHWLVDRRHLVDAAQRELVWFAKNAAIAAAHPKDLVHAGAPAQAAPTAPS